MAKSELLNKLPPQNVEAEAAVLGAILVNKEAMDKIADIIGDKDFYRHDHQIIFRAILRLYDKRSPIDLVTLTNELESLKQLDEVGGAAYLATLVNSVPTAIHVTHYAEIVRQKAVLRRILAAGQKITQLGYEEDKETAEVLDEAEKALFNVSHELVKDNFMPIADILAASFDRIDKLHREKGILRGVTTGFKDLDNKLSGLQPSDLIILAARPSMGKCVAASTQILDPKTGQLRTIQQLVDSQQGQVVTMTNDWQFTAQRPAQFVADGNKPTFAVTTALGHTIEATLPHPFLTVTGWKHLAELKVGDRVAMAKKLPFFGTKRWPEYKVKVLAYLLADGSLTGTSPRFTNVNSAIIRDYAAAACEFGKLRVNKIDSNGTRAASWDIVKDKAAFSELRAKWAERFAVLLSASGLTGLNVARAIGVTPGAVSMWKSGGSLPTSRTFARLQKLIPGVEKPELYGNENPVSEFLKTLGVMGKTAHTKTIPEPVFSLTKEQIALFINRLFSCDGTAYVAKSGTKEFPVIAYASASETLIKQVQHLLTRFGIISKVRAKTTKSGGKTFASFELEIHGKEDLLTFCKEIGIFGKEAAVERVRRSASTRANGWTKDTVPLEVWSLIEQLKGDRSWRELAIAMGLPESHNFHAHKRAPRRETVRRFATVLKSAQLAAVANSDIYWDRITAIKPAGVQPVYDLTIGTTHNFVANSFVVHNTTFALNMALAAAVKGKTATGFFSLEQSKEQIVDRLICAQAMVDGWKLRTGNLSEDDFPAIGMAMGTLAEAPLFIDDSPGLSILEIRTRARRLKAEHNLGLIVVDYLQLIEGNAGSGNSDNRVQQVSEISRHLKGLARELDVPVVALSQLSRAVESRDKKIPQLSDLRESGSIEQDADVVMFLYREDYYERDTERKGITDVLIRKHRNGPIGEVELHFRAEQSRFFDIERKSKTPARASSE